MNWRRRLHDLEPEPEPSETVPVIPVRTCSMPFCQTPTPSLSQPFCELHWSSMTGVVQPPEVP